jgi:hypothetical protein
VNEKIADIRGKSEIIHNSLLASIIQKYPKKGIYYSEETSRREEYVKMRTTLDVAKRSNNNLQFRTDANPAKKLKLMDFKPLDFDISEFNNDFTYEPKNKKHDFPNWEVYKKNKLSRTHNDQAGKFVWLALFVLFGLTKPRLIQKTAQTAKTS